MNAPLASSSCAQRQTGVCHLLVLLLLLLTSCRGSETTPVPNSDNGQEEAIERLFANAPDSVKKTTAPTTRSGTLESGLPLPEVNPIFIKGGVYIAGSAIQSSLNRHMYERFVADGYADLFKIEDIGTSAGFAAFCHDDPAQPLADLAAASRPMLQKELDACFRIGRLPIAFWVAMDALVVVVHRDNDFIKDVTLDELRLILKARQWSDVNPAWPERRITRILSGPSSHNFDFTAEVLFAGDKRLLQTLPNAIFPQDEQEIVQQLKENGDAISIIGYESYLANRADLHLVLLNGLEPTATTVQESQWPFSRPILLYSTAELLQSKPQVSGYLTYFLTYISEEIGAVGKFPLKRTTLDRTKVTLLVGTANTAWLDDLATGKRDSKSR